MSAHTIAGVLTLALLATLLLSVVEYRRGRSISCSRNPLNGELTAESTNKLARARAVTRGIEGLAWIAGALAAAYLVEAVIW